MSYGIGFDGRGRELEKGFCAAVVAACLVLGMVLSLGWIAGIGARDLWRSAVGDRKSEVGGRRPEAGYPDPACEVCGKVLDGSHQACEPEGFVKSAACSSARGKGEP